MGDRTVDLVLTRRQALIKHYLVQRKFVEIIQCRKSYQLCSDMDPTQRNITRVDTERFGHKIESKWISKRKPALPPPLIESTSD